jgi:hypothetical protein
MKVSEPKSRRDPRDPDAEYVTIDGEDIQGDRFQISLTTGAAGVLAETIRWALALA